MASAGMMIFALALCSPWQIASAYRRRGAVKGDAHTGKKAVATSLTSKKENDEDVTVRLLLTRHALSCANAVDQFGLDITHKKMHIFMPDPMLTDCGVHRSKKGSEDLLKIKDFHVDFVLSSSMLRAMETAAFMFPGHTITPVPYISEHGFGYDNKPKTLSDQLKTLKMDAVSNRSGLSVDRLDLHWSESGPFSGRPRRKPSWSNFKKFMADSFLPNLPANLQKKDLTIAVVTHSNFLKNIPELSANCKEYYSGKPGNNQVFELKYRFTNKTIFEQITNYASKVVGFRQDFEFDEGSGCKSLIEVQGKQTESCQRDFGEVCEAEIQEMSKIYRPSLRFWEEKHDAMEKEDIQHGKTTELDNFICCTST